MPAPLDPPSDDTLRRFLLGSLPAVEAEPVAAWVEADGAAVTTVRGLAAEDPLTDAVRASARAALPPEPEVSRVIRSLCASVATNPAGPAGDLVLKALAGESGGPAADLGGYRVVRELGRGGMGVVYEAADDRLGRRVALKVMTPAVAADPAARARFLREARAAAAVEDDHIVPVLHVGEDAETPFLVMPLLAGQTLAARLAAGPLPVPELLDIGGQVAAGLAAAHAAGLVHRDVKPSNIWLELHPDGSVRRARLLDFGLARTVREDDRLTHTGGVVGTAAYMAPEQARGLPVDGRADLFSLGCVLYEMATGKRAFDGTNTFAILTAVAVDTPPRANTVNPAVPGPLADLIARLMAKEADDRTESAKAVGEELAALAVPGVHPQRRRSLRPRRPRRVAVVASLCAGVLVAVGLYYNRPEMPPEPPPPPPPTGEPLSPLSLVSRPAKINGLPTWDIVPESSRGIVYVVAFRTDGKELATAGADQVIRFYDPTTYKLVRAIVTPVPPEGTPTPITSLAWSPDGKQLAAAGYDAVVRVWNVEAGAVAWQDTRRSRFGVAERGYTYSLQWSPDGRWLAVAEHLLDARTGKLHATLNGPEVVWSPDGKVLVCRNAILAGNWFLPTPAKVWDLATTSAGRELGEVPGLLAVTDDGKSLVVRERDRIARWDIVGRKAAETWVERPPYVAGPSAVVARWSADRTHLWVRDPNANVAGAGRVFVFDTTSGKVVQESNPSETPTLFTPDISPAARMYAGGTGVWHIDTGVRTGPKDRPALFARPSPDGRKLLVVEDRVGGVWDARTGRDERVLFTPPVGVTYTREGDAQGLTWRNDELIVCPDASAENCRLLAWKPDGTRVAVPAVEGAPQTEYVAFTRDGSRVAAYGLYNTGKPDAYRRVAAIRWGNQEPDWVATTPCRTPDPLAWSPDGKHLVVLCHDSPATSVVVILDGTTGKEVRRLAERLPLSMAAWTGDTRYVVTVTGGPFGSGKLTYRDAETGKVVKEFPLPGDTSHAGPPCSPAGLDVALLDKDEGTIRVFHPDKAESRVVHRFVPGQSAQSLDWSADGKALVFTLAGIVTRIDPVTGTSRGVIISQGTEGRVVVAPDGHASGPLGRVVYVAQTKTGQQTLTAEQFAEKYGWKNDPTRAVVTVE